MAPPLRILHLEDDPDDAALVRRLLAADGLEVDLRHVQDLAAFREALGSGAHDLVLSDFSLGGASGLEALELTREVLPDVPFIFMSGALGEERAVETLRRGANDYVLKDRPARLGSAIRRAMEVARNAVARKAFERALEQRALQQASVAEIGRAALEGRGFDALAQDAAEMVTRVLGAEGTELHTPDAEDRLVRVAGAGPAASPAEDPSSADGPSPSTVAYTQRTAVVIEDVRADPQWAASTLDHGARAAIAVPLQGNGRVHGVLAALFLSPRACPPEDVSFVQAVAHVLAATAQRRISEDALRRSEEQLRHSQKMEAVGLLAGGVAHDFNNLLTAIVGYAELLSMRMKEGDAMLRDVAEIRKAADRASGLTRQLLAFSRKQVLAPRVLDLNGVVSQMENLLRRVIGEDIQLVSELAKDLRPVRVDPGQLEQVILNLAVNARDAMPRGGLLTIETRNARVDPGYAAEHPDMEPGRYVLLSVTDTGTGMDAETKARIFEPFFTTKEQGKGTGLGLSTVYGIVRQSGGHVWVYSEPGRGACFKVYLPQERQEVAETGDRPAASSAPRGWETVLLVEDEPAVRDLARQVLQLNGYRTLEAGRASEALDVVAAHDGPVHLLVTDVVMPGMSGPELAERLRQDRPEARVLFLSGYTARAAVRGGMVREGSDFLQKPFTPSDLATAVRAVLDRGDGASRNGGE